MAGHGHVWTLCLDMSGHSLTKTCPDTRLLFTSDVHTCCSQVCSQSASAAAYSSALRASSDLDILPEALRKTIIKAHKVMITNRTTPKDVFTECIICQGRTLNIRASIGSMRCTSAYCKMEYSKKKETTIGSMRLASTCATSEADSSSETSHHMPHRGGGAPVWNGDNTSPSRSPTVEDETFWGGWGLNF